MTPEKLFAAAMQLPHRKRAELASLLIRSLEDLQDAEWRESWAVDSERRLRNVQSGRSREVPLKDVILRARSDRPR